jgi:hypothetical protein
MVIAVMTLVMVISEEDGWVEGNCRYEGTVMRGIGDG